MKQHKRAAPKRDALSAYYRQLKKCPPLTPEEERVLVRQAREGDEEGKKARQRLIEANLRLVFKLARTYASPGEPLSDLIQEGNIGLIRAVEKYDPAKNSRFATYACWWIRQAMSRYLSDRSRAIRIPHRKEYMLRHIRKACQSLSQTLMRQPSSEEIAGAIGVPVEEVEQVLRISRRHIPLEQEDEAGELPSVLDLQADYTYSPERIFFRRSLLAETHRSLGRLQERERRVLEFRYLTEDSRQPSLKSVGEKMGISAEMVRQIEMKAFRTIRQNAPYLRYYLHDLAM